MNFASDNWAGAHPAIAAALHAAQGGFAEAYGDSDRDREAEARFSEVFGREVAVYFVATGTAANSLALTAVSRPGGVAFCHRDAHLISDECGAFEYLSGGNRLCPVGGRSPGKIDPAALETAIDRYPADIVHFGQPMAVSITQSSEVGTVYTLEEIAAVSALCRRRGLPLHMDGARFANALAALDTDPAQMSHEAGVDILSFGATKNGCWCAEAVVFFDPAMAGQFAFLRKRAAQLFSKSRFIAEQFLAYFADGLWLEIARHSNRLAARLGEAVEASRHARLAWRPEANEVFVILGGERARRLRENGAVFAPWRPSAGLDIGLGEDEILARFVTSFAHDEAVVDRFAEQIDR